MIPDDTVQASQIAASVVFERVREFITRFVRLSESEATAITLWTMMTHALGAFDCVPYLSITSAEKQSGKTRLLEVLELIVAKAWLTGRTTPAVLSRKIHAEQPTLLLDESDATFKGDKEFAQALRGVLNTGYLRSGKASLCVTKGKNIECIDFSTFGPKAIAGIGALPDTVADRSIPIRLSRKLATERVERFRRRRVEPEAYALRTEVEQWAALFTQQEQAEPSGLENLPDRAADICEPLLTIAEACGAEVAAHGFDALVILCGREREDQSLGVRVLADIRSIFDECGSDRIASAALAARLAGIEESPWRPRFGRDFDARELAKLLKSFGIRPTSIRLDDGSTPKGYYRHDFTDVWERYLASPEKPPQAPRPPQASGIECAVTVPVAVNAPHVRLEPQQGELPPSRSSRANATPQSGNAPGKKFAESSAVADVSDVADALEATRQLALLRQLYGTP
jgi:Protein of unknown function (DUF3631)